MTARFDSIAVGPSASGLTARGAILHFTPNWFAVTMGTGILSAALAQFPDHGGLYGAGLLLWLGNMGLFALFALIYALKWRAHARQARRVADHAVLSMFLGCIPMGLATIVNGWLLYGVPLLGPGAVTIAAGLWLLDALLAVLVGVVVPFWMFTRQDHAIPQMTAVWLLPIVAAEVAAASGALLLPHLADPGLRFALLLADYALWSASVPLALGILVILFLRLVLHKLPPAAMAATSWLALGPVGTGALALALLSVHGEPVLAGHPALAALAPALSGAGLLGAFLLWAYGLWWLVMAAAITVRYRRQGVPFNLGWWGYIFPLGVYALATLKLGQIMDASLIADAGQMLIAVLALLWILVACRTAQGTLSGALIDDPAVGGSD